MAIHSWKRTIFTIQPGIANPYSPAQEHTNIFQVINRVASGGGNVFIDDETNPNVSNVKYSVRIDPGTTGALIRPYSPKIVYFYTDSVSALTISITEVITDDIHYMLPPTQLITGSLSANLAGTNSNASSGVATSSNNLGDVSYLYGFNGSTWDQIQVDNLKNLKVAIQGTPNVAVTSMPTTTVTGSVSVTGTPNVAVTSMPTTTVTGSVGVSSFPTNGNADGLNVSAIGTSGLLGYNGTSWDRVQVDANKNLKVIATQGGVDQTQALKSFTFQTAATAVGNGTVADVTGYSTMTLDVVISATASVTYEGSIDGTNYVSTPFYIPNGSANTSSSSTVRSIRLSVAGFRYFRARISSYSSGTVDVTGIASTAPLVPIYPVAQFGNADSTVAGLNNILGVGSFGLLYNNSTWDRSRNNLVGTGLASAARTSTTTSSDFTNYNHRGIVLSLNVTVASGAGGLQVQIQAKDTIASAYKAINTAPTAITATGQYIYMIYPGIDTVSNNNAQNVSQVLPQIFRISITHGDASSYTYSVNYHMIL